MVPYGGPASHPWVYSDLSVLSVTRIDSEFITTLTRIKMLPKTC